MTPIIPNIFILMLLLHWECPIICPSIIVTLMHQIYQRKDTLGMGSKYSKITKKTCASVCMNIYVIILWVFSISLWCKLSIGIELTFIRNIDNKGFFKVSMNRFCMFANVFLLSIKNYHLSVTNETNDQVSQLHSTISCS